MKFAFFIMPIKRFPSFFYFIDADQFFVFFLFHFFTFFFSICIKVDEIFLILVLPHKLQGSFSDIFFFFFHRAPLHHLSASSLTRTLFTYFSEPGVIALTLAANSTQGDLVLIPPVKVERFHQFCFSISRSLNPDGFASVISIFMQNLLLRMLIEWHLGLILSLF